ncbi:response regulator [Mucilaginibacter celer]|uniref:Response regulator n=1 Tax=Mucilaginibacter celer TaxID=2305508 RepID=A0A494VKY8_9SPHI|nr:response regulator [Mucilaginibacter celer]AYL95154.1 response regulator [Mucilaginibacter celer]
MKSVSILLVEDNEGDIILTTEALSECKIINEITIKRDGREAVEFFEGISSKELLPDIVLLDINLPKMSGHEVLMYLKTSERYRHLPVIMLTTSSSENDLLKSYKNHVNCYIVKPIDANDFINAVTKIEDFWINIVSIPPR